MDAEPRCLRVKLDPPPPWREALGEQISVVSGSLEERSGCLVARTPRARVEVSGGSLRAVVEGWRGLEDVLDVLKLVYRWLHCVQCGSCEVNCPSGAISVSTGKPVVDSSKCTGCRLCIDTCVVCEVYFESVVAPLILGGGAEGRPSRRRISETVRLQKRLHGVEAAGGGGGGEADSIPGWLLG